MFAVDNILISDEVLDAAFACNLGACHGACCVVGDAGAPLEEAEREPLEAAVPHVRHLLSPDALAIIDAEGPWEASGDDLAVRCVDGGACVFVTHDGPVATCALQKAYHQGRIPFEKPISCHLYPIRVERYGDTEVLNYEQIDLCRPARKHGRRCGVGLPDFLRGPLERKYGADWYARFREAVRARRDALGIGSEA